jgi:8-oxo-dGTP pyrophosphatase MutT (NUDIX family)
VTTTFTDPATWYASLPTMYGTASALITAPSGEVLLVKPNYRDHWSVPGGILEDAEPPEDGCAREVLEEIGLDLPVGPLLAAQWIAPSGERPKPLMAFMFDGGVLKDFSGIVLQESELDDYRPVPPPKLGEYLPPVLEDRVRGALRARDSGAPVYLSS